MPEPTEKTEVEVPVQKTGSTEFLSKEAFNNPAPLMLKRVLGALRNFALSLVGIIAATDLISGSKAKAITLGLVIFMALLEAIKVGTGVVPLPEDK